MNKLSLSNINISSVPDVINFMTCSMDSNKFSINTDIKNINFIKNWMQIISNPKIHFNVDDYTCDAKIEINNNTYCFIKAWPCSVLDLGQFCVIEFIYNHYYFDNNIIKPYINKPYIIESNKKEIEKIIDELDDWLKNPEKDWEKRLVGNIK